MSFWNRVASCARKTALALGLATLVTAANPSAVAEPYWNGTREVAWQLPWTVLWNLVAGVSLGLPSYDSVHLADETPPPSPPTTAPTTDHQTGSGTAGGSGHGADPNGGNGG